MEEITNCNAMPALDKEVLSLLEYRMNAVAIGHLALRHKLSWDNIPSIEIFFDGKLAIEGKATAFTNSAFEVAIIHGRALLEFLGLAADSRTKLKERTHPRKTDDIGVEHFGNLSKVSVGKALRAYPGERVEAESALAYVIYLANKGLAHCTSNFTQDDHGATLLLIAFQYIPLLVVNNFYAPLGLEPPAYMLQSRKRNWR